MQSNCNQNVVLFLWRGTLGRYTYSGDFHRNADCPACKVSVMCLILSKTETAQQLHIKFTNIKFHKDPFSYSSIICT